MRASSSANSLLKIPPDVNREPERELAFNSTRALAPPGAIVRGGSVGGLPSLSDLPTVAMARSEFTSATELSTALRPLARELALSVHPRQGMRDCGSLGACGYNSLGRGLCAIGRAPELDPLGLRQDYAIGRALRERVVQHARDVSVLFATSGVSEAEPEGVAPFAHLIASSLAGWCTQAHLTRNRLETIDTDTWACLQSLEDTWMDEAALALAADLYSVAIRVYLVQSNGARMPGFGKLVYYPRLGRAPVALVELACISDQHFVLVANRLAPSAVPSAAPLSSTLPGYDRFTPLDGPTAMYTVRPELASAVRLLEVEFARKQKWAISSSGTVIVYPDFDFAAPSGSSSQPVRDLVEARGWMLNEYLPPLTAMARATDRSLATADYEARARSNALSALEDSLRVRTEVAIAASLASVSSPASRAASVELPSPFAVVSPPLVRAGGAGAGWLPSDLPSLWLDPATRAYALPVVEFYSGEHGEFRSFSNFYHHEPFAFVLPDFCGSPGVTLAGCSTVVYVTFAEKAVMLCKAAVMEDYVSYAAIASAATPDQAKILGRKVAPWDQSRWSLVVCDVALAVVTQKFVQVSGLADLLLSTGERLIGEMTARDKNWGTGLDSTPGTASDPSRWPGTNILGWALMVARYMLRSDAARVHSPPPPPPVPPAHPPQPPGVAFPVCSLPGCDRPCFVEASGHLHDFCRRGHAVEAARRAASAPDAVPTSVATCSLAGCDAPCFVEASGRVHDYCRRGHAVKDAELSRLAMQAASSPKEPSPSPEVGQERQVFLDSFVWPLTSVGEVMRLLTSPFGPTDFVGFEFSGAVRGSLERGGRVALSADRRPCDLGGMHACVDVLLILHLRHWERAYLFPPCFQQLRADEDCLYYKLRDGRAFWGCAVVIFCLCVEADLLMVEQPDTIVSDFIDHVHVDTRTSAFGDPVDKFIRLFVRNTALPDAAFVLPPRRNDRFDFHDYYDAESRDREKSSWAPHVQLCAAVADLRPILCPAPRPFACYLEAMATFACRWHAAGHAVPKSYLNPYARPPDPAYQLVRGPGDGRQVPRWLVAVPRPLGATAVSAAHLLCALVAAESRQLARGSAGVPLSDEDEVYASWMGSRGDELLRVVVTNSDTCKFSLPAPPTHTSGMGGSSGATPTLIPRGGCRGVAPTAAPPAAASSNRFAPLAPDLDEPQPGVWRDERTGELMSRAIITNRRFDEAWDARESHPDAVAKRRRLSLAYLHQVGHTSVSDALEAAMARDRDAKIAAELATAQAKAAKAQQLADEAQQIAEAGPFEIEYPADRPAPVAPTIDVRSASEFGVFLIFISVLLQPLVLAHVDGFTMYGMELPAREARSSCLVQAQSWVRAAVGVSYSAFMVGEYLGGARVMTAPVDLAPPPAGVCRTRRQRVKMLASGCSFVWCTLAALGGTPIADAAARCFLSAEAFVKPVGQLADFPASTAPLAFRFGASAATSIVRRPLLDGLASAPSWRALQCNERFSQILRDALQAVIYDPLLDGWLDLVGPLPVADIPPDLLTALPSFNDEGLEHQPFSAPYVPVRTPWMPLPPAQEPAPESAPSCVRSPFEMMLPTTQIRVQRWLRHALTDLISMRDAAAAGRPLEERDRPGPLAVGDSELHAWARGRVWDCRGECCEVADFRRPISTHLNLAYLERRLRDYPDRFLVACLLEGARLDADVELQTVLVPHLVSLPLGYASVEKELRRLHGLGWYDFFSDFPFWPMYLNGQGATARKLEPDRFRRTTEGGGPRRPTFDASGLQAISINSASKRHHMPQHFLADKRPTMLAWLFERGLPGPALPSGQSKWPKEIKPLLEHVMHDIAILRRASEMLGEPLYIWGDDAKDYFNQLAMASSELHKLGIIFLARDEDDLGVSTSDFTPIHAGARLVFVSELRLGFGTHGASNIAQRFSEALLAMFREDLDAEDAAFLRDGLNPRLDAWLAARRGAARSGARHAGRDVTPDDFLRALRLYAAFMYTDDPVVVTVGVQRTLRALRVWRRLTNDVNLIMAIPEKRNLGTHALWLGVLLMVTLGIVVVPRHKLLRAAVVIRQTLAGGQPFHVYRALCGLLEHFRAVNLMTRQVMHGLYTPHQWDGASRYGPSGRVECDELMRKQLERWLSLLGSTAGVSVRRAFSREKVERPPRLTVVCCADACGVGDVDPCGIGGYCHSLFWYFRVPVCDHDVVTTPFLEFIAAVFDILTFGAHAAQLCGEEGRILLRSDALTTALTLPSEKMKAPMHVDAYQALVDDPLFARIRHLWLVAHLYGDCNALSDPISRSHWATFYARCRCLGVRAVEVEVPAPALRIYRQVVALERARRLRRASLGPAPHGGALPTPQRASSAHTTVRRRDAVVDYDSGASYSHHMAMPRTPRAMDRQPPAMPSVPVPQQWESIHWRDLRRMSRRKRELERIQIFLPAFRTLMQLAPGEHTVAFHDSSEKTSRKFLTPLVPGDSVSATSLKDVDRLASGWVDVILLGFADLPLQHGPGTTITASFELLPAGHLWGMNTYWSVAALGWQWRHEVDGAPDALFHDERIRRPSGRSGLLRLRHKRAGPSAPLGPVGADGYRELPSFRGPHGRFGQFGAPAARIAPRSRRSADPIPGLGWAFGQAVSPISLEEELAYLHFHVGDPRLPDTALAPQEELVSPRGGANPNDGPSSENASEPLAAWCDGPPYSDGHVHRLRTWRDGLAPGASVLVCINLDGFGADFAEFRAAASYCSGRAVAYRVCLHALVLSRPTTVRNVVVLQIDLPATRFVVDAPLIGIHPRDPSYKLPMAALYVGLAHVELESRMDPDDDEVEVEVESPPPTHPPCERCGRVNVNIIPGPLMQCQGCGKSLCAECFPPVCHQPCCGPARPVAPDVGSASLGGHAVADYVDLSAASSAQLGAVGAAPELAAPLPRTPTHVHSNASTDRGSTEGKLSRGPPSPDRTASDPGMATSRWCVPKCPGMVKLRQKMLSPGDYVLACVNRSRVSWRSPRGTGFRTPDCDVVRALVADRPSDLDTVLLTLELSDRRLLVHVPLECVYPADCTPPVTAHFYIIDAQSHPVSVMTPRHFLRCDCCHCDDVGDLIDCPSCGAHLCPHCSPLDCHGPNGCPMAVPPRGGMRSAEARQQSLLPSSVLAAHLPAIQMAARLDDTLLAMRAGRSLVGAAPSLARPPAACYDDAASEHVVGRADPELAGNARVSPRGGGDTDDECPFLSRMRGRSTRQRVTSGLAEAQPGVPSSPAAPVVSSVFSYNSYRRPFPEFANRVGSAAPPAASPAAAPARQAPVANSFLARFGNADAGGVPFRAPAPALAPRGAAAPLTYTSGGPHSTVVGGLRVPRSPATDRAATALGKAGRHYAAARVAALAGGPNPAMHMNADLSALVAVGNSANELAEFGANSNTLSKDVRAWEFWELVCRQLGTDPLRTAADVRDNPDRQAFLLTCLMLYASAVCVPKTPGRKFIKPRSALAYPLAVIRIYGRWGIAMPGYRAMKGQLHGLMRQYLAYHGPYSLAPRRAEPMRFEMVMRMNRLSLTAGHKIRGKSWSDDTHDVFMFRRINVFIFPAGTRLAALVSHSSGEIMFFTRSSVWLVTMHVVILDPTPEQWRALASGAQICIAPPREKPDPFGEIHCPFPITFTYDPDDPECPAAAVRDIELRFPCRGAEREHTPLFADANGAPYTHGALDDWLKAVLRYVFGNCVASIFTWHSYRSGLATALHASGCPDAMIMLICRWMCPESLHVYRRMGTAEHERFVRAARNVSVDVLQSANAPRVSNDECYAEIMGEFAQNALERQTAADFAAAAASPGRTCSPAVTAPRAATPRMAPLPPAPTDGPALTASNAKGRRVLIVSQLYPQETCDEHGGVGWEAVVQSATSLTAVVRFTSARSPDGRPYEDERLPLQQLRPL